MSSPNHRLPDDVVEVARRGNIIEAIKLLRPATGLGLKESKELIDAFKRGDAGASSGKVGVDAILGSALTAMRSGSRPEAIKLLREQLEKLQPPKHATPQKTSVEPPRHAALQGAREPADYRQLINIVWWALALSLAGAVAYYFLGKAG